MVFSKDDNKKNVDTGYYKLIFWYTFPPNLEYEGYSRGTVKPILISLVGGRWNHGTATKLKLTGPSLKSKRRFKLGKAKAGHAPTPNDTMILIINITIDRSI